MGFMDRFRRTGTAVVSEITVAERVSVVGESHYQPALRRACGTGPHGDVAFDCVAELVPEPTNRYDPNAVMVRVDGECVGYLSKSDAVRYRPRLDAVADDGQPLMCGAFIGRKESTGNPNLGIVLEFSREH